MLVGTAAHQIGELCSLWAIKKNKTHGTSLLNSVYTEFTVVIDMGWIQQKANHFKVLACTENVEEVF